MIISMQSKTINELYMCLAQYMTQDELDTMPAVSRLNAAANIGGGIDDLTGIN